MELKELLGESYKDGMTLEEVTGALAKITMPKDQSAEIEKLKASLTKANGEAADWRRQFEATQSDEAKKKLQDEEEKKKLLDQIAELQKAQTTANYKNSYLAMGYEEKLAEEAAKAMTEGDTAKVFEIQKKHQAAVEERVKKDLLKKAGRPVGDDGGNDGETEAERIAKQIGKLKADSDKAAADVMKYYGVGR